MQPGLSGDFAPGVAHQKLSNVKLLPKNITKYTDTIEEVFKKGDKVKTPDGEGKVVEVRSGNRLYHNGFPFLFRPPNTIRRAGELTQTFRFLQQLDILNRTTGAGKVVEVRSGNRLYHNDFSPEFLQK